MRIQMGDTNDHTLTEGDIDIADATTRSFRFYLYLSPNIVATADDTFNIFELQQAGGATTEASMGLRITAATGAIEIGLGDGAAADTFAASILPRNVWIPIEWVILVSTSSVGTSTLYVDGTSVVALTSQDAAAAVGTGAFGTQDTLSTTTGTILFDAFVMDDVQVYPFRERFPLTIPVTQSGHVFVGPGTISGAALLSTTSGNIMRLYDTDVGSVTDAQGFVAELDLSAHTSIQGPLVFERGCFAQLTGTNPRGQVILGSDEEDDIAPRYYTEWGYRHWGLKRSPRQNG